MKYILYILLLASATSLAQTKQIDSLQNLIKNAQTDTSKIWLLNNLAHLYKYDSASLYLQQALTIADKNNYNYGRLITLIDIAHNFRRTANYPKALETALRAEEIAEQIKDTLNLLDAYYAIMSVYGEIHDAAMMLKYARKSNQLIESNSMNGSDEMVYKKCRNVLDGSAVAFTILNKMDSARLCRQQSYQFAVLKNDDHRIGISLAGIADTYVESNPDSAIYYFHRAIPLEIENKRFDLYGRSANALAKIYLKKHQIDSALYYGQIGFQISRELNQSRDKLVAADFLQNFYADRKQTDSAYKYLLTASASVSYTHLTLPTT